MHKVPVYLVTRYIDGSIPPEMIYLTSVTQGDTGVLVGHVVSPYPSPCRDGINLIMYMHGEMMTFGSVPAVIDHAIRGKHGLSWEKADADHEG